MKTIFNIVLGLACVAETLNAQDAKAIFQTAEPWKQETDIIRSRCRKPECGACTGPDPLDELDRRCAIAAREYIPDPEKGEWASDSHRDPFNEVREWIAELRQRGNK